MNIPEELRKIVTEIRRRSYPISDIIPTLTAAADLIDRLEKQNSDLNWGLNPERMGR